MKIFNRLYSGVRPRVRAENDISDIWPLASLTNLTRLNNNYECFGETYAYSHLRELGVARMSSLYHEEVL